MAGPRFPVKKRVLVIEDEAAVRFTLQRLITLCGQEVSVAENGAQGLQHLGIMTPDLILLDISLPDSDGLAILRQLHEKYAHLKVIMLASEMDVPTAQMALNYGASDYLSKPIDFPALKRSLELHLPSCH